MSYNSSITIIGAGCYGTALAMTLAQNSHQILLWGHNPIHVRKMQEARRNQTFLKSVSFPTTLRVETSLSNAISSSRDLLIVVPSHAFRGTLIQVKPYLRQDSRIVWATKGLEQNTGRLLHEVAQEILGNHIPLAVISGPTFANELAIGLPTAIAVATTDSNFSSDLYRLLFCVKNLQVYANHDLIGVQLSGAIKNVIAIGTGISDGIGFGASARTILITHGLAEISRLGVKMGADPDTFKGIAGMGDLILTCTNDQSRNRRFGLLLGRGESVKNAKIKVGQLIEGYDNIKEVLMLAKRYYIEMPVTKKIYEILYEDENTHQAILHILNQSKF